MNTIDDTWRSFAENVIHVDAPQIQRNEMKKAFYAGAYAVLCITCGPLTDADEDDAVRMLEGLHEECRQFVSNVVNGSS